MREYSYKNVDIKLDLFEEEIAASIVSPRYAHSTIKDSDLFVSTEYDLTTEEKTALDDLVLNHDPSRVNVQKQLKLRQLEAMDRGRDLMAEFGSENKSMVAAGVITAGDLFTISANMANVQALVSSGSLEMAQIAFSAIPEMVGLDQARKDKYDKILQTHLDEIRVKFPIPGEGS